MQYPVIDLMTNAYLNNGWTGLEVIEGKNLLNPQSFNFSGGYRHFITNFENERVTISFALLDGSVDVSGIYFGFAYELPNASYSYVWNVNNGVLTTNNANISNAGVTGLICSNVFMYPSDEESYNKIFSRYNIQIEKGTEATPYEPYAPPTTDIANRLKLPLPHYFPHPVIDALRRAAAGTQTADDTEVLRHYLTPLGIGGI